MSRIKTSPISANGGAWCEVPGSRRRRGTSISHRRCYALSRSGNFLFLI